MPAECTCSLTLSLVRRHLGGLSAPPQGSLASRKQSQPPRVRAAFPEGKGSAPGPSAN